ncbi:MAG: metal ABC transporter ATP-binding protein [Sulfuricurvum sp.]|nr:metal ABC transporter ATP-binding protein [Sulfuricurvum sp.]MBD3799579.1 metal ABC transporter ATP-binding protein [Campylobacterota bacterium]MBD3806742.1 metal ABC transporter ATP-binding protein [Sulfuricurvum sp.]
MKFSPSLFEVNNLRFERRGNLVLKNGTFQILRGEYCAIIGPNGGGKTTLVRLLLGLEKATSGEIKLFGYDQKRFRDWSRIGYVPQRSALIDESFPATVREVVAMGRYAKRGILSFESDDDKAAIDEAMDLMGVSDLSDRLIGNLSGGQRQRVMIARALASNPDVLIVDEPNTGVDVESQHCFYGLLRTLNKTKKLSILFVTHDIGVIAEDITRVLFVNQSILVSQNPAEIVTCNEMSRLYGNPSHVICHNH